MAFPKVKRYGWKPDHPDHRDLQFAATRKAVKALPPSVDLRPQMPAVFDQGELGSCTANAVCGLVWYQAIKEAHPSIMPSRLFEYYNTRVLENTVKQDAGASIRDSVKTVVKWGFCTETDWPYDISKFAKKPPAQAFNLAKTNIVKMYHSVPQTVGDIKTALSGEHPVDFGFTVYESFESDAVAKTGIVPMPKKSEKILGGHSVLIVGYDDSKVSYILRNSWGGSWGLDGYFYMPYDYVHNRNLASDFWVINAV